MRSRAFGGCGLLRERVDDLARAAGPRGARSAIAVRNGADSSCRWMRVGVVLVCEEQARDRDRDAARADDDHREVGEEEPRRDAARSWH